MKKIVYRTSVLFIFTALITLLPFSAFAENESSLTITRAFICQDVADHEPIETGTNFTNDIERLYCFSEISGAAVKTHITHIWYYKGAERARKQLRVHAARWRTYSSKLIQSYETGTWEVKIIDAENNLLQTLKFNITPK